MPPGELHELHLYPVAAGGEGSSPAGRDEQLQRLGRCAHDRQPYFLTELLREQYGFDGYVVSDSRAVEFISEKHHVAPDFQDGTRQVVEAGWNVWTNSSPAPPLTSPTCASS